MSRPLPITLRFSIAAFVPISLALLTGFFVFGQRVEEDVRHGIGETLSEAQRAQANLRRESASQRQVLVAALAENPLLKAGLALWRDAPEVEARRTVEDQLKEIGAGLHADLMGMVDANGRVIAVLGRFGVESNVLIPLEPGELPAAPTHLVTVRGVLFDTIAAPVNSADENLGILVVGRRFDVGAFHPQAVLMRGGKVVRQAGGQAGSEVEAGLVQCGNSEAGCSMSLGGSPYVALRADVDLDDGYTVWTLHSVDRAASQILGTARTGLWASLAGLLIAAFLADLFGARAVAQPLIALGDRLKVS